MAGPALRRLIFKERTIAIMNEHRHEHAHEHGHGHLHGHEGGSSFRVALSLVLTVLVFLAELIGGFWTHSLALQSDAWHVLTDVLALALTWLALQQARRKPTQNYTFGFHRTEVVAAFINGLTLFGITVWILVEAVHRFFVPVAVRGREMFFIALIGLTANLLIALLLNHHAGENLNIRSAFLHVIGDALASVGVILAGLVVLRFHWYPADPLISVGISLVIIRSAYRLTGEALRILMEGTPPGLDLDEIVHALAAVPGVKDVHDLHIWNITGNISALSMHVVVGPDQPDFQRILDACNRLLASRFGVFHSTIQLECSCPMSCGFNCSLKKQRAVSPGERQV